MEANTPLLNHPPKLNNNTHKPSKPILLILCSIVFLISLLALTIINSQNHFQKTTTPFDYSNISPKGVAQGVSPKSNPTLFHKVSYNWTNAMFSWQRTAFHFQPQKNWMNGKFVCVCVYLLLHVPKL